MVVADFLEDKEVGDEESSEDEEAVEREEEEGVESDEDEEEEDVQESKSSGHLDKFWLLTNAKSNISRITASSKVLKYISENPSEVNYSLKRLVRGLASPLETSRQSFFVCLVEFLRQNKMEYSFVKKEIKEALKATGSKGEESLFLLGQILSDIALLRSGLVQSEADKLDVLENLASNGSKRTYLNLIAINAIIEFYMESDTSSEELVGVVGRFFKLKLEEAGLDSLLFILSFVKSRGSNATTQFLTENFGFKEVTKKSNLEKICRIVTGTTLPLSIVLNHPVVAVLAALLKDKQSAKKMFAFFIPEMNSSLYKGQIGVCFLRECLKADRGSIEDLLTADCLESLKCMCIKGVVNPIIEIMDIVEAEVKAGNLSSWNILNRILECSVSWDKYVPGNTATFLFSESDADTVMKAGELLEEKFKSGAKISDRIYASGLLVKLIGHPKVITNIDWRIARLTCLLENTIFAVEAQEFTNLTKDARFQLREVFYRGLDSTCKTLIDNINVVHSLMRRAVTLVNQGAEPLKPFKDSSRAAWDKVVETVSKLGKDWKENSTKETGVFLLLFSHIGLQLFCEPEMAVDVLSELQPVYANWKKANVAQGTPAGIEVVVEILLSLMAQNKHLLRKVVNCIFKVISEQMTEPALLSILDVLSSGDENKGDDDSDDDDDDDENEDDEDESEIEESDEEKENEDLEDDALEKIKRALGDHAEKSEVEDSDIDMDDIPDEDMQKLDEKLVQAFKALGGNKSNAEKKKEKLDHLANQHFKLRVLDLIEIYIQHKPDISHFFLIISSLLESFKSLSRSTKEQQLCNKIKVILKKCTHSKLESSPEFDCFAALDGLLQFGSSPSSAIINLGNIHAKLCLTALRINLPGKMEPAEKLYLDTLKFFFTSPSCVLSYEVFSNAVGIPWEGAISLAKEVSERAFDPSVKHYRRSQGLAILSSFMKNQQFEASFPGEKTKIMKLALEKIILTLSTEMKKGNPKQLQEIFSILKGMKQQEMMSKTQVSQVQNVLKDFAKSSTTARKNAPVKKSLRKLLSFYNLKVDMTKPEQKPNVVVAEVPEADEEETDSKKKKKKKKKSNEAAKRKKEERLKAGEEDPSAVPSFSEFLTDTTQVFKETSKKKKIKKRKNSEPASPEKKKKKSKA